MTRIRIHMKSTLVHVAFLVAILSSLSCGQFIAERRAKQVQPGHTEAEVQKLLGKPERTGAPSDVATSASEGCDRAKIDRVAVYALGDSRALFVFFDRDARVVSTNSGLWIVQH